MTENKLPFTALGMDDKGRAVFQGRGKLIIKVRPASIKKRHMLAIASLAYWEGEYGYKGKISWDAAVDFLLQLVVHRNYNPKNMEGEGTK